MAEEAVVQKVAQVREEVVVSKTLEQRTEQIDDTVRKTEVEVDEGKSGSAFGFKATKTETAESSSPEIRLRRGNGSKPPAEPTRSSLRT
jgi:hypothetical protein